jgi:hypothetical protein
VGFDTSKSILVRRKQSKAASGRQMIGLFSLNDALRAIAREVRASYCRGRLVEAYNKRSTAKKLLTVELNEREKRLAIASMCDQCAYNSQIKRSLALPINARELRTREIRHFGASAENLGRMAVAGSVALHSCVEASPITMPLRIPFLSLQPNWIML